MQDTLSMARPVEIPYDPLQYPQDATETPELQQPNGGSYSTLGWLSVLALATGGAYMAGRKRSQAGPALTGGITGMQGSQTGTMLNQSRSHRGSLVTMNSASVSDVESVSLAPPLHGPEQWEVHKFGGASLADAVKIKTCGDLLIREARGDGNYVPTAAIVSAMKDMTGHLVSMAEHATAADMDVALKTLDEIVHRQKTTIQELVGEGTMNRPDIAERVIAKVEQDKVELAAMLKTFKNFNEVPPSAMAFIAGTGEVWSAQMLSAYLEAKNIPTQWLNARDVLIVESESSGLGAKGAAVDGGVTPLYDVTADKLQKWWETEGKPMHEGDPIMIITGFVASTPQGVCTTLKRSGSDHSATIFAFLLKASRVTLWKEMDGIFTADPRAVPSAGPLSSMTYEEANEIAYFGGEVIHPSATQPCLANKIPIYVRNFNNPACAGTVITDGLQNKYSPEEDYLGLVKGLTAIENIAMVRVNGGGWGSVAKLTQKAMNAMNFAGIKVVMVTQGSSAHSLSFAIDQVEAERALDALKKAFELELLHDDIEGLDVQRGFSLLTMVTHDIFDTPGLASPFFKALSRVRVNIFAIAQGSSNNSLSVVVAKNDLSRALGAAHTVYEPLSKDMSMVVLGKGLVGSSLLKQINKHQNRGLKSTSIQDTDPFGVRVIGVADSKDMVLHETGLPFDTFDADEKVGEMGCCEGGICGEMDLDKLTDFLVRKTPQALVVDCSGSQAIVDMYPKWLARGIHVVSANYKAGCADWDTYCRTFNAARKGKSQWLYGASLGSGLLINTVRDLLRTGDEIHRIEGCFSGTLASIFESADAGMTFSEAVQEAQVTGYTETDPRDDLSGSDLQRKVVILAREAGLELSLEDVEVESLVPKALQNWTPAAGANVGDAFIQELKAYDDEMAEKLTSKDGKVLRYAAVIDIQTKTAKVALQEFDADHPFAKLGDIHNACLFYTDRFPSRPLMVQGPGIGNDLIAACIFADVMRLGGAVREGN